MNRKKLRFIIHFQYLKFMFFSVIFFLFNIVLVFSEDHSQKTAPEHAVNFSQNKENGSVKIVQDEEADYDLINDKIKNGKFWAVLFLPSNHGIEKKEWLEIFEKFPEIRLTVALSPEDFASLESSKNRIMELMKEGRVEIASRLDGDPPLPIIYDLEQIRMFLPPDLSLPSRKIAWPEDVSTRVMKTRTKIARWIGKFPAGFVPGGGSLSLPIAEFLKKQKFIWTVGGFPKEEWFPGEFFHYKDETSSIHLFSPCLASDILYNAEIGISSSSEKEWGEKMFQEIQQMDRSASAPLIVFDEKHAVVSLESFLRAFQNQAGKKWKTMLCSELSQIRHDNFSPNTPQIWPYSWNWMKGAGSPQGPGLSVWIGDPQKNKSWDFLSGVRGEIIHYKNSGRADIESLDKIMEKFYRAESGDLFEMQGSFQNGVDPKTADATVQSENKFMKMLSEIYADLDLTVPKEIRDSVSHFTEVVQSETGKTVSSIPGKTKIRVDKKENFVTWIQSEDITMQKEIEKERVLIKKFSVRISTPAPENDFVSFSVSLDEKEGSRLMIQIYIDINRREGAGNRPLIRYPNISVRSKDGWEYLLEAQFLLSKGWDLKLFRANDSHPVYQSVVSSQNGSFFEAKIPKNLIGRDPLRWGYLIGIIKNNQIDDFLSSVEDKKQFLEDWRASVAEENEQQLTNPSSKEGHSLKQFVLPMVHSNGD